MSDLQNFQKTLGYQFNRIELLEMALTHPSTLEEHKPHAVDNQRLEFLGDAVLGLVLSEKLYLQFPDAPEGPLTKARAHLVNEKMLAAHAKAMGIGEVILIGKGEELNGGRERRSLLADAFEAVLGAIFLDAGFDKTREIILGIFADDLNETTLASSISNPKGELQEFLQVRSSSAPHYRVVSCTGPDHDRVFECSVHHEGVELGRGKGKTKREAEMEAAAMALQQIRSKSSTRKEGVTPTL